MGVVIHAEDRFAERRLAADRKRGKGTPIAAVPVPKSGSDERTARLKKALEDLKNKDK